MPISGVVVTCTPAGCAGAAEVIAALQGVEVHGVLPGGRIIAVIEAEDVQSEVNLVSQIHEIEGVASVNLAYHNFEEL